MDPSCLVSIQQISGLHFLAFLISVKVVVVVVVIMIVVVVVVITGEAAI